MFIDKSENPIPAFQSNWAMKLSLVLCVLGIVVTGFFGVVFDHIVDLGGLVFSFIH
jgi:hypothetical protein